MGPDVNATSPRLAEGLEEPADIVVGAKIKRRNIREVPRARGHMEMFADRLLSVYKRVIESSQDGLN